MPHVLVDPAVILAAATELDLLAERLAAVGAGAIPVTHVAPSGGEEVSLLAAGFFNRAAGTFEFAHAKGILQLHHAAARLRLQLAEYIAQDALRAGVMNAVEIPASIF